MCNDYNFTGFIKDDNNTKKHLLQLEHITIVAVNSPTVDVIGPVVNTSL